MSGQIDYSKLANIEAEQAIIGSILMKNSLIFNMGFLNPEDFFEEYHQRIYATLYTLILRGELANPVTMKDALQSPDDTIPNGQYLVKCAATTDSIINVIDYAKVVKELSSRRNVLGELENAICDLLLPEKSIPAVVSHLTGACMSFAEGDGRSPLKSPNEVSRDIAEDMKRINPFYETGLEILDTALLGGLYTRRSYVIAAEMGAGKTMMLGTIWYNLAHKGVPVLYIAAEMGSKEIHRRNISRLLNFPARDYYIKRDDIDFLYQIENYATEGSNLPGALADVYGLTFDRLKYLVHSAIETHGIRGFILDYIGLVKGAEARESEASFQERVAQWIADVCKERDIFGLYAAQINREGKLRGSDGPKASADMVLELCTNKSEEGSKIAWLTMLKSRYTPVQKLGDKDFPSLRMHPNGPHFKCIHEKHDGWVEDIQNELNL